MHWSSIVFLGATLIVFSTAALTIWIERKRELEKRDLDLDRSGDDRYRHMRVDRSGDD